ncbi:hypothetical protein EAO72_18295 [Streptomyces sp. or43]|nr:hypothetical protein EAO72_18295 [Streptomyces sp. or43]
MDIGLEEGPGHPCLGEGIELGAKDWGPRDCPAVEARVAEADVPGRLGAVGRRLRHLVQAVPGLRTGGVGTLSAVASRGTRRQRAVR